mmetsp:Transcript_9677/g.31989  ORF Transcript_9677/g.31989 Transcript_9677/m.31989 type:complete len:223 (+) Transcript_9677:1175-1843(+)
MKMRKVSQVLYRFRFKSSPSVFKPTRAFIFLATHLHTTHATTPTSASGDRYFFNTFGGCNMLNSSVASFPANNMMAFLPPGWSGRNAVRSYTLPSITTQTSPEELCFAISCSVREARPPEVAEALATTRGADTCTAGGESYAAAGDAETPANCEPAWRAASGLTCALTLATRFRAVSGPVRCPPVRSCLIAEESKCRLAVFPATLPNTTQSSNEFPPNRLRP